MKLGFVYIGRSRHLFGRRLQPGFPPQTSLDKNTANNALIYSHRFRIATSTMLDITYLLMPTGDLTPNSSTQINLVLHQSSLPGATPMHL